MNGADALCDTLLAGGIDTCFANPGTSEMHFVAALDRKPAMRCVLALFEGVATGAADGYARMLGKPAATLLHLGPGLANGLANLHNARRAFSPLVNIVGDHATHHLIHDAPLTSDIESLARPMSHWVRTTRHANDVARDAADAIVAARSQAGAVATLILPADAAWGAFTSDPVTPAEQPASAPLSDDSLEQACRLLRNAGSEVVIMLGSSYLRADAREAAAIICQGTGARLLAQQSNARLERGAGRVPITRTPYPVDQARALLQGARHLLLFGAKAPVGFFAYPDQPGSAVPEGCEVHEIASLAHDPQQALQRIVDELGLSEKSVPRQPLERPGLPIGALDADAVLQTVAALMPEHAILCDETISSGRNLLKITEGAPAHDILPLNGGAIGIGLPLATGASIACPDRKVICLQADGSAMYTVQALWTQARENLDVVTVIFSNRSYALLHQELRKVGAGEAGENARRMLDIDTPALDWRLIAGGLGVEAATAATTAQFAQALQTALRQKGPFLIEAKLS